MQWKRSASPIFRAVGASALIGLLAAAILAQSPGRNATAPQAVQDSRQREAGLTLSVDTNLVQIPVTVTDAQNRFVLGLRQPDFHLVEDGAEQVIAHFSGDEAPLSVGLVFDESGSMDYKLQTSRVAVNEFLKTMNAADETYLVEFSDAAKTSVRFTSHPEEIQNALKNLH